MNPPIRTDTLPDGGRLHLLDLAPAELPPVGGRDLSAAWDAARDAASRGVWGEARAFRFRRPDGGTTDIGLADRDALSWAGAVDRKFGLHTVRGVSLCLRLLALVDVLCRARWAASLFDFDRGPLEPHAVLLRLAAEMPLDDQARFDESILLAHVQLLPATADRLKGAFT